MSDFPRRVRDARERRGWDQSELVRRLAACGADVSQQTVSRWERGLTRPRGQYLDALVDLLEFEPVED